jgi:hypothetical protein
MQRNYVHFIKDGQDIRLPRPEYGNGKRLDFTRINRRSRGGDLIVYRDPQWPKTKTLTLTFAWLTEAQKQALLSFLHQFLATPVQYHDHYGDVWEGIIMTPAANIVQESLNNLTVTLDFQGEIL